jgi:hypothetical protein
MSAVVVSPPSACRSARSRAATREVWRDRLARFPSSGLTVAQFCAIEACSVPSFYGWKRRLAAEAPDKAAPHHRNADGGARLLPVRLQPAGPPAELVLPSGAVLRLPTGCDLAWVRSLVAALGGAAC